MKTVTIPESEYKQLQQTIIQLKDKLALFADLEAMMPWLKNSLNLRKTAGKKGNGKAAKILPIVQFERSGTPVALEFGSGKHLVKYMADDFTAPLEQFKDYM